MQQLILSISLIFTSILFGAALILGNIFIVIIMTIFIIFNAYKLNEKFLKEKE